MKSVLSILVFLASTNAFAFPGETKVCQIERPVLLRPEAKINENADTLPVMRDMPVYIVEQNGAWSKVVVLQFLGNPNVPEVNVGFVHNLTCVR